MKTIAFTLISLLFFSCGFIVILPMHTQNDQFKKHGDLARPFNESDILGYHKVSNENDITLQEITCLQLNKILKKSPHTWVILSASWCSHCYVDLLQNSNKFDSLRANNINVVYVYTSYDIKHIRQQLFQAKFFSQAYILDAKEYSSVENVKIEKFQKELVKEYPQFEKFTEEDGIPQNFFYNGEKLNTVVPGGDLYANAIKKYFD